MLNHLFVVWKHNLGILTHDQVPQPLSFYNRNMHVGFGNKQQYVLHKFLLWCIILLIKITIPKMICDGLITNDLSFFELFLMELLWIKSNITYFPPTLNNCMLTQDMIFHRSTPMLLVVRNHIFLPFGGTTSIVTLANKMANHTMHSLK